ncbi:MAG TPA: T9SS type A sorting domain-containing protein [Bacteroidia bacterium]|nr:T9SS type A sorting domain-containing protein [Bacteroidia bacterium]
MQASTTYNVRVASRAGGVWSDYGDVCTITTPATLSRLADTASLQEELRPIFDQLENSENLLSLSVFPNPNNFDEDFSIEIKGIIERNQKIKLSILNMLGASVFRSDIITMDENRVIIQPEIRLATGIYIVEADLKGVKLRKRFVVQ